MVENLILLASTDPKWGKIEPIVFPIGQNPTEEPDLAGPGQPPRRIGIGGGLEDFGGDQIPPQPPTAENDEPEDRYNMALEFLELWRTLPDEVDVLPKQVRFYGLLKKSGLVQMAQSAILRVYDQAVNDGNPPSQLWDAHFGIDDYTNWRKSSTGIFSENPDHVLHNNEYIYSSFSEAASLRRICQAQLDSPYHSLRAKIDFQIWDQQIKALVAK